ncbi:hypothetical protein IEO21_10062 [Rhodonia placenta]|uniref:Uncharacterized protein n=1 Tax=Rhodonia placenta TaxID=104341 RepID=A0A8H7NT65_9APHY|nr:hypothetical protein IEO21_10062 [Postia placenta]
MSANIVFIICWNVAGELHSPKNITVVLGTINTAFHSSPFLIRTLLYPAWRSIFVNTLACLSLSRRSDMSGSGY